MSINYDTPIVDRPGIVYRDYGGCDLEPIGRVYLEDGKWHADDGVQIFTSKSHAAVIRRLILADAN